MSVSQYMATHLPSLDGYRDPLQLRRDSVCAVIHSYGPKGTTMQSVTAATALKRTNRPQIHLGPSVALTREERKMCTAKASLFSPLFFTPRS